MALNTVPRFFSGPSPSATSVTKACTAASSAHPTQAAVEV